MTSELNSPSVLGEPRQAQSWVRQPEMHSADEVDGDWWSRGEAIVFVPLGVEAAIRAQYEDGLAEHLADHWDSLLPRELIGPEEHARVRRHILAMGWMDALRRADRAVAALRERDEALRQAVEVIDTYVPRELIPFKVAGWRALATGTGGSTYA